MPKILTINGVRIPTTPILLALGVVLGLGITCLEGRRRFKSSGMALDLGLWVVIGGFAGGWIGSLLIHLLGLGQDWGWNRTIQEWGGQLSFHGAFLGGLLGGGLFARSHRRGETQVSFWELADTVTPGLALGMAAIWASSFFLGQDYLGGKIGLGFVLLPDLYGVENGLRLIYDHYGLEMHPLRIMGIGLTLVLGVAFWLLRKRWSFPGAAFLTFVLLYSSGQFLIQVAEANLGFFDVLVYLGQWRLEQVLDLMLALSAAVGLLALWWRARDRGAEATMMGKRYSPAIPLVVGLAMVGLVAGPIVTPRIKTLSPLDPLRISLEEASDKYEKGQALLVDVRSAEEYAELHVTGALSLPETDIEQRLEELPHDKDIILYCA